MVFLVNKSWKVTAMALFVVGFISFARSSNEPRIVSQYSIVTKNYVEQSSSVENYSVVSSNFVQESSKPIYKYAFVGNPEVVEPSFSPNSSIRSARAYFPATIRKPNHADLESSEIIDERLKESGLFSDQFTDQLTNEGHLAFQVQNVGKLPSQDNNNTLKPLQYLRELNASANQNSKLLIRNTSYLCSEFYDGEEFYIRSPNYPFNYPAFTSCRYTIRKRPNIAICGLRLTVLRFDLPASLQEKEEFSNYLVHQKEQNCKGDRLVIDGHVLCGRLRRGTEGFYHFPKSVFSIEFQSGQGFGASGFLLKGKQIANCSPENRFPKPVESSVPCNRVISNRSFVIDSPGYPMNYPHELECRYVIKREYFDICGLRITLDLFDLEGASYCMFDYVEIQGKRHCGQRNHTEPLYYMFEDESIAIRFRTDELVSHAGFRIKGEQVPCHDLEYFQPIDTPLVNGRLPNLTPIEGDNSLELQDIGRALSHIAPLSFLNVREGPTASRKSKAFSSAEEERELDKRGVTQDDVRIHPLDNDDYIFLNYDDSVFPDYDGSNFNGSYLFEGDSKTKENVFPLLFETGTPLVNFSESGIPLADETSTTAISVLEEEQLQVPCDEQHSTRVFLLQSPNYPNLYPNNVDCVYYVTRSSPDVCQLRISVEDLHIAKSFGDVVGCLDDYFDVAGDRLCGDIERHVVHMAFTGRTVAMRFHTNSYSRAKGFLITVEQVSQGCQEEKKARNDPSNCNASISQKEFTLVSPGFPGNYSSNLWCATTLLKDNKNVTSLQLDFDHFDVEKSTDCIKDYLLIDRKRICGYKSGSSRVVPFPNEKISFVFVTNEIFSSTGFRIKVKQISNSFNQLLTNCGSNHYSSRFLLTTPGFPHPYPHNLHCTHVIVKNSPKVCQLQFKILAFDIEESPGCQRDYLQYGPYPRLCGKLVENELVTYRFNEESFNLVFHSDSATSRKGYQIEVHQLECQLISLNGSNTSQKPPIYPVTPQEPPHFHLENELKKHIFNHKNCAINHLTTLLGFLQGGKVVSGHLNPPKFKLQISGGNKLEPSLGSVKPLTSIINSTVDREPRIGPANSNMPSIIGPMEYTKYKFHYNLLNDPSICHWCKLVSSYEPDNLQGTHSQLNPASYKPEIKEKPSRVTISDIPDKTQSVVAHVNKSKPIINISSNHVPIMQPQFPTILILPQHANNGFRTQSSPKPLLANRTDTPNFADSLKFCNKSIALSNFIMRSPGFPGPFYVDMHCYYSIRRLSGSICALSFLVNALDLPSEKPCDKSYVSIAGRRLCGTQTHPMTVMVPFSSDAPIVINYRSDMFQSGKGFSLHVRQIPCSNASGSSSIPSQQKTPTQQPPPRAPFPTKIDPNRLYHHSRSVFESLASSAHQGTLGRGGSDVNESKKTVQGTSRPFNKPVSGLADQGPTAFPWIWPRMGRRTPYAQGSQLVKQTKWIQNKSNIQQG